MNPILRNEQERPGARAERNGDGRNGHHLPSPGATPRGLELDTGTVTHYLLRKGILTPEQVVEGRLSVEDISRRNRNFRVRTKDGVGFLVKQAKSRDAHGRSSLLLEAQILRFIATSEGMKDFRAYAPTYRFFDARQNILVTELIHPATSVTKLHLYYGKISFPVDAAEAAGRLLGRYHAAGEKAIAEGRLPFLRRHLVNGLTCPTAQFLMNSGTPAGLPYWNVIRDEAFVRAVPELQKRWREHEGIVHGDARWMNYLLTHGEAPDGGVNLRIIDWEMAQIGDSVWDAACWLGDYVRFATQVARVHKIRTVEQYVETPPYPPPKQHKSADTFWTTYCKTRRFTKKQRRDALERIMDYLPCYVALVGYEMTEANASSGREFETMESARLCAHLARRAHEDREKFLKEWFGIDAR